MPRPTRTVNGCLYFFYKIVVSYLPQNVGKRRSRFGCLNDCRCGYKWLQANIDHLRKKMHGEGEKLNRIWGPTEGDNVSTTKFNLTFNYAHHHKLIG